MLCVTSTARDGARAHGSDGYLLTPMMMRPEKRGLVRRVVGHLGHGLAIRPPSSSRTVTSHPLPLADSCTTFPTTGRNTPENYGTVCLLWPS
jgi:hypothetical protein